MRSPSSPQLFPAHNKRWFEIIQRPQLHTPWAGQPNAKHANDRSIWKLCSTPTTELNYMTSPYLDNNKCAKCRVSIGRNKLQNAKFEKTFVQTQNVAVNKKTKILRITLIGPAHCAQLTHYISAAFEYTAQFDASHQSHSIPSLVGLRLAFRIDRGQLPVSSAYWRI